jgi:hypothetical protein
MKTYFFVLLTAVSIATKAQQGETVDVPKGVVYKYSDSATNENAKAAIRAELSDAPKYSIDNGIVFIGPGLWSRYGKIPALAAIKGGDMTILGVDRKKPTGKISQRPADFKMIWDQLRSELKGQEYIFRKATYDELRYYWAVISFDIEEPLIIIETKEHRYLLDMDAKALKLIWLDEIPAVKQGN